MLPRTSGTGRRSVRAARLGATALAAVLLTAGCAAGKIAQTAYEKPTLDGIQTTVGALRLDGIAFSAPTTGSSYQSGASVPLQVYISNQSQHDDALTGISSPDFSGWGVVATATAATATGGGGSQTIPANSAVSLGLQNVGNGSQTQSRTAVLTGLKKTLWAGSTVPVTFTFKHAGSRTVRVPVQLTTTVPEQSVTPAPSEAG